MALASWPTRRLLALWAGGLVLEALLIFAPAFIARHLHGNRDELLRAGAEQDARWRTAELADSLSLAKQRAASRTARTYSVNASGDTLFPLVRMPSGRPNPEAVATRGERTRQNARYLTVLVVALVPTLLILLTFSWMMVRRRALQSSEHLARS